MTKLPGIAFEIDFLNEGVQHYHGSRKNMIETLKKYHVFDKERFTQE